MSPSVVAGPVRAGAVPSGGQHLAQLRDGPGERRDGFGGRQVGAGAVPVARDNQFRNAYNMLFLHAETYGRVYGLVSDFHLRARGAAERAGAGGRGEGLTKV